MHVCGSFLVTNQFTVRYTFFSYHRAYTLLFDSEDVCNWSLLQINVDHHQHFGEPAVVLPVHKNVICDVTEMNPIVGVRFHKIGEDYDLCEEVVDSR